MKRIIAMVRTSTDSQSIEDQHNEMVEFCQTEGFKASEIEWVETQGASAAKEDDAYLSMIAKIKNLIETNSHIEALAVWHLNRAFRTEDSYVDLKKYLVAHKVNLICKNPYLRLLTPDGKVDKGMELAAGLLAILAKQDQEERKEKFHRAKKANAAKGKFNGGNPKFGYKVDENGFVVPNEPEVEILTKIYELYATGKYSSQTLARELSDLGITRNGVPFTPDSLVRILVDTAYIGWTDSDRNRSHRTYIPIIDRALWDAVEGVRKTKYKSIPRTGETYVGFKIVKCPVCGGNLHRDGKHYVCWKHNSHSVAAMKGEHCSYALTPPTKATDSILWKIASDMHMQHLAQLGREDLTKYHEKIETIDKKIATIQGKIEALERRKSKVVDSYIDELIDKAERDHRLAKISTDAQELNQKLKSLKTDRGKTEKIIKQLSNMDAYSMSLFEAMQDVLTERDTHKMLEIVQTYILSCTIERTQFGPADYRSTKPNALEYTIKAVDGYTYKVLHLPCSQKGPKYYAWNGRKYEPLMLDIIDC